MAQPPIFAPDDKEDILAFFRSISTPEQRAFYSQWSEATQAYAEAGFSAEYYEEHVLEKLT